MSTIIFRIPSKVQYGYVEVQATPEELGGDASLLSSPELMAEMYVRYAKDYREREEQALKASSGKPEKKSEDLDSFSIAKGPSLTEAADMIKDGLGATEVDDNGAPYKKTPPKAKAKPWEGEGAPKAPDLGDLFA